MYKTTPIRANVVVLKQMLNLIPRGMINRHALATGEEAKAHTLGAVSHLSAKLFDQLSNANKERSAEFAEKVLLVGAGLSPAHQPGFFAAGRMDKRVLRRFQGQDPCGGVHGHAVVGQLHDENAEAKNRSTRHRVCIPHENCKLLGIS